MASYIESTLAPNERVVANAKVMNAIWVGPVIFALIIALLAMGHPIFLLLGLLVLLIPFLVQRTTNLAVTDRRIIAKFGVL